MSINISDKYKCIFIHIPRAAGTSIKEALDLQGRGHLPWQYYYLVYPEQWISYYKFSIVRNPWDRVISAFNYTKMDKSYWHDNINQVTPHPDYELLKNKSFKEFCEMLKKNRNLLRHEAWHPQHKWIVKQNNSNMLMVDCVLRFENLERDFSYLCQRLDIRNINLPRINPSNHEHYRQYYTDETKLVIEDVYEKDIELFKYKF